MIELLWWIFAALAVLGGLFMVTRENPVASLLSLVLTLFSLAVLFVLMEAHFIAAVQVIVYAGAIMVLFLFVIMLLNLGHDYKADLKGLPTLIVGSVVFGFTAWLLTRALTSPAAEVVRGPGMLPSEAVAEHGAVGAVAMPLLQEYVVGFEVASLLLLAAIVGAILLAKRRV